MGFRSTFVTDDSHPMWPSWFMDKYKECVHFSPNRDGTISSKWNGKTYGVWGELPNDIRRAMEETNEVGDTVLIYLHDCGGITRCRISQERIQWSEPTDWFETDGVTHYDGDGCWDVP